LYDIADAVSSSTSNVHVLATAAENLLIRHSCHSH